MKKIMLAVSRIWYFFWGNIAVWLLYERKYLKGEWFKGKYSAVFAPGWKWVYYDAKDRLFHGKNVGVPWPVSGETTVIAPENITFDSEDLRNFQMPGNYFQAIDAHLTIGKGTWIASNIGLITSNHAIHNPKVRGKAGDINIGENCWIGMNSVILPGVTLGNHTIVGAGSVVTKSFEGNCVIAGNPAKIIRHI